ncbi:YusG family protein [Halalkalibacterium halodurans]|uniref:BH3483 protein n=1 Tax=Halalkalibacterium halodurans (strain ATCC BAA-125 / DSM 18197 / FERM 7344 / JCM 9153 / C-125) TaxID=272558 RepID=Q9K787_HALH5|nr:YusG family protein [Halalkalibacterium halodurans]MED4124676.1 YusG family protein [Halalkalibacterium halodurans]MED4174802.1 YusG family protein [Halalkalibacterium halodurans]BAB07202.1 BH3483 [Halalkalibacterium halodurans C-125]
MDQMKVDVTNKVHGKLENGHLNLYIDRAKIGRIIETNAGLQYEMAEGFDFRDDKVFQYENPAPNQVKSYVEGCDQGWC